jgi:tetratricopeptide (TPR) repeat protein
MATVVAGSDDLEGANELVDVGLIEAASNARVRAEVLAVGAILNLNAGRIDIGEARAAEARELFGQTGDAEGVARMLDTQAMALLGHGRFADAADQLADVARLFFDSGMLLRAGTTKAYLALVLVQMNRVEEAHREALEAHQLESMLGHHDALLAQGIDALALAGLGRLDEATAAAEEAVAGMRRTSHRTFLAGGLVVLGIVHRADGQLEKAEAFLRESLDVGRGLPLMTTWAAAVLARLLVARGDFTEAERYVALAINDAGAPIWQFEARLALAELAAARHDPAAREIAREALAMAEAGGHLSSVVILRRLAAPAV